ncbi:hypothetical protein CPC08DRAFT_711478 [Agrocybe pediades]|nr:hypothetical protein CPC08DRAFT_711478 [Agrocybe pediades]
MQSLSRHASITVLHDDLLWKIFLMNTRIDFADEYHDLPNIPSGHNRPLNVARHCSQVCRRWRSIFLSSSSIWGRLIDLDGLRQKTDEWRKEVVARSGESLLWVYGKVPWDQRIQDFIFALLKRNWGRVQRLLVVDNGNRYQSLSLLNRQIKWAFLNEPAPQLESIRIKLSDMDSALPSWPLLEDCPLLRSFGIFDAVYRFSIGSSWLRNLSSVTFSSEFTTGKVLYALRMMTELVSLTVSNEGTDSGSDNHQLEFYPQISLPKLRMLTLEGDARNAGTLLHCITPAPGCSLSTTWIDMPIPGSNSVDYEQYEQGVSSYIVPYFSLHAPSAVELYFPIDRDVLLLEAIPSTRSDILDYPRRFSIELYPSHLPSSFLVKELITCATFSRVTTLHMPIFIMRAAPRAASDLIYILEAFSSLTTLSTTDVILSSLLCHPQRTAALFPGLIELKLIRPSRMKEERSRRGEVPAHERFLHLRKDVGRPIAVLELGFILELQRDRDHLESELPGLLVKWSTISVDGERCPDEYRCGDEEPEKLRFSRVIQNLNVNLYRGN